MKEEVKKMLEPLPRLLFTVPEGAAILGVNENMVHDLRKAGLLKAMKLGRYKIRKSTLEAFLVQYDGQDIGEILSETAV